MTWYLNPQTIIPPSDASLILFVCVSENAKFCIVQCIFDICFNKVVHDLPCVNFYLILKRRRVVLDP